MITARRLSARGDGYAWLYGVGLLQEAFSTVISRQSERETQSTALPASS